MTSRILLTTNCLVPLRKESTYLGRLFTTGVVSYPGAKHIADRPAGGSKDFSGSWIRIFFLLLSCSLKSLIIGCSFLIVLDPQNTLLNNGSIAISQSIFNGTTG